MGNYLLLKYECLHINILFHESRMNLVTSELTGIGIFYKGQGTSGGSLFSDPAPENVILAERFPVQESNTIVEMSIGYNDNNIE